MKANKSESRRITIGPWAQRDQSSCIPPIERSHGKSKPASGKLLSCGSDSTMRKLMAMAMAPIWKLKLTWRSLKIQSGRPPDSGIPRPRPRRRLPGTDPAVGAGREPSDSVRVLLAGHSPGIFDDMQQMFLEGDFGIAGKVGRIGTHRVYEFLNFLLGIKLA
jgi:hypothetical protein